MWTCLQLPDLARPCQTLAHTNKSKLKKAKQLTDNSACIDLTWNRAPRSPARYVPLAGRSSSFVADFAFGTCSQKPQALSLTE